MRMKTRLLFAFIFCLSIGLHTAFAQKSVAPEHYTLESDNDYRRHANDVLKCIEWLEATKVTDDDPRYSEVVNFLGEWVSGCPFMNYTTNVRIDAAFNNSPDLRVFNKAGWAKNAIENNYKSSALENYMAGVRCALKAYKNKATINRSKSMDNLVEVDKSGKLKDWVADKL